MKREIRSLFDMIVTWMKEHGVNTAPKLWWVYLWLIIGSAYYYYEDSIYKYISETYGDYLTKIYNAVGFGWINILAFVGIIYAACKFTIAVGKDKLFSWKRVLVELMVVWLMVYHQEKWLFAELAFGINYRHFLLLIIAILLIIEFFKVIWHRKAETNSTQRPYITDYDFKPEEDYDRRKNLAEVIVNKALATDLSKESFSVGITGGWGTGKSTMLECVKKAVGDKAYIVDFNPWNSQSASQIINDFFSELRSSLCENYSTLAKPIMRYAKLLADVEMNPVEKWATNKLAGQTENDISDSKTLLSKELCRIDKPIVVLIDDTDRLEGNELFEVLRLVRNTAKLPNLIYFVAFDKSYLVGQLEKKNMPEASQYIEKIFQLEIAMPYAEKHLMVSALYYDLNMMQGGSQISEWLYKKLGFSEIKRAMEILGSYRQVKRFARLYITQLSYMKKTFSKSELNFVDLFWLTIIQLTDYEVYEDLFKHPEKYLDPTQYNMLSAYSIKEEILKEDYESMSGNTKDVLKKLFSVNNGKINNSLMYVDNYFNYFYMGLERGRISLSEFESLLGDCDEIDEKMKDLCQKKGTISWYHRLSGYDMPKDMEGIKSYFMVLTAWMNYQKHSLMGFLFEDSLKPYHFENVDKEEFRRWFIVRMKKVIEATDNLMQVSSVLNKIYPEFTQYEAETSQSPCVISRENIKELAKLTFAQFVKKHPDQDAYDILDKGKLIGGFYRNFIVVEAISDGDEYTCNMVVDEMISYFSEHKSEEYNKCKKYFELSDEDRAFGYSQEMEEDNENNKLYLFGSNDKFNEYLEKCFVKPNADDKSNRYEKAVYNI